MNSPAIRAASERIVECRCGGSGYVRVKVKPGTALFGQAIPCVCTRDAVKTREAARLRQLSHIPEQAETTLTFETFDALLAIPTASGNAQAAQATVGAAKALCQSYAQEPQGWLILFGDVGGGKTHLAVATAVQARENGVPVYWDSWPDLLQMLRDGYDDSASVSYSERLHLVQSVHLLVLDDLGAARRTDWSDDVLFEIVNMRYRDRLPMLVTTNASPFSDRIPRRVQSRLCEGVYEDKGKITHTDSPWTRVIHLDVGDYRSRKGAR